MSDLLGRPRASTAVSAVVRQHGLAGLVMLCLASIAVPAGPAAAQGRGADWGLRFDGRIAPTPPGAMRERAWEGERAYDWGGTGPVREAAPRGRAVDAFDALAPFGELMALEGETVWRPFVDPDWRPFIDGAWDYDPRLGWVWAGADPWSSITDHAGTWREDAALGWFWSPRDGGREAWSPARVTWRIGSGVIGWAPLDGRGEADPRAFVFVPIEALALPGEAAALTAAESRAVYRGTRPLSADEVARLDPRALLEIRDVANLDPRAREPIPSGRDAPLLESARPPGRFTTPGLEAGPDAVSARPLPPLVTPRPPLPSERPAVASLPDPAPAETGRAAPPVATAPPPVATDTEASPAPTASAEAGAAPTADENAPRVVGPRWLANGDCSSRGIREGRCRSN